MALLLIPSSYSPNRHEITVYYVKSGLVGNNNLDVLAEENDAAQATVYLMRDWRKF